MSTYHRLSAISRLLASLRPAALFQDPAPSLPPPIMPDADCNGGIGWSDVFDPGSNILVMITAYQNMQVGDIIELLWDGQAVDVQVVDPDHMELGIITFWVSPIRLEPGTSQVHFRTTSQPGGNVRTSHPYSVRIKIDIPGGFDPDPATPNVNENLLPVTGVPDPVDESNADSIVATVLAYKNMTEGDKIKLSWNGEPILHTVLPGEVDQSIALDVPREIIERVGAGEVLIRYEVRDVVNNWSRWSLPRVIDAEVGSDLLRAPDALDAVTGKIDLDALGDQDARVQVRAYSGMAAGDVITLTWRGNPPIGEPVEHVQTHTVTEDDEDTAVQLTVPNAIAMASAGGVAAITYTVTSDRGTQRSRRTSVEIIGQVQRLAPPTLREAAEGSVDLDLIPESGATVVVAPYPGMASGQRLELFAIGTAEDGPPSSFVEERDITESMVDNPVPFTVPKAFFRPLVNGSLCAYYRVQGEESDRLRVNVIDQTGAQLPAPSVAGVVDGALDPDAVPNGTNATVPQYPGKAPGDRITLFWHGVETFTDAIVVTEANSGSPINFHIAHDPYIVGNLNSDVAVRYWVKPSNGDLARSVALNLPIRRKAQDNFVAPTVLEAVGATLDPYNALNGATVRVAYEGMLTTDKIGVAWINPATGQVDIAPQDGSASGEVHFDIPVSVVAASQGQTIDVVYAVVRGGNPGVPSEPLNLQVSVLDQAHLPTPAVPQADASGTLDLATFEGDASVTVAAWPLIAAGQHYWIKVSGTLNTGMPHSFYVAQNQVVTAGEVEAGLNKPMLRTELENLKDSTALRVEMKVAFDGVDSESSAIAFPVKTYTVKSLEIVTPIIDSVVDDKDRTIPNNGATTATTVKLTGTASIRRQVQIFNSGTSLGTAMSDDTGAWTWEVPGLSMATHSFRAIGRYGDEPESDPFTITVVDVVTPAITRVSENNRGISNGGSTTATTVLLRGTASVRQLVEIYEGSTWLETVRSNDSGTWYKTVTDLAKRRHSFTAKGLYGAEPESDPFTITVVEVVTPIINRVTDDKGVEIPDGGVTTAAIVTLHGIASIRQQLEILNGGTSLGGVTSDAAGGWTRVTGLTRTDHTFTAKGLYGVEPISLPYTVKVLDQQGLPTPVVPQAQGTGTLDLATFAGDALVTVTPWQFIATGQRYWIKVNGTLANGTPHSFDVARNQVVTAGEVVAGLSKPMLRTALETLRHDSALTVEVRVAFDGATEETQSHLFPTLGLKLLNRPDLVLALPVIALATANRLEPGVVPDSGLPITVRTYEGMAVGDTVKVMFGNYATPVQTVRSITDMQFNVPVARVDSNAGTRLDVFYEVTRNTGGSPVTSPSLNLDITSETQEDFEKLIVRQVPEGETVPLPSMSLHTSKDFATITNSNIPPYLSGRVTNILPENGSRFEITLTRAASLVTFGAYFTSNTTITVYDESDSQLSQQTFRSTDGAFSTWVTFSGVGKIKKIVYVSFNSPINSYGVGIDNFTLRH